MLSKNNKILIGCLALLLVMSVGYALFSDTITINGTATAKGEFDITATCQPGILSKLGTAESLGRGKDHGYQNDSCSAADDTISLNTEFLYPGARRNFTIKMTNTGTIDAVYDSTKNTTTYGICVADNIEGENKECETSTILNGSAVSARSYKAGYGSYLIALEDPNGNLVPQSELIDFILDAEKGIYLLKPGYSAYSLISVSFNHVNPNGVYEGEEFFAEYNFKLNLSYEQAQ